MCEIAEGMGGLVGLEISRKGRKLHLDNDKEELCAAKSCQVPQAHNKKNEGDDTEVQVAWVRMVACS